MLACLNSTEPFERLCSTARSRKIVLALVHPHAGQLVAKHVKVVGHSRLNFVARPVVLSHFG